MVWHGIMGIKGRVSIATAFDMKAAYTICMKKIWEYESFIEPIASWEMFVQKKLYHAICI